MKLKAKLAREWGIKTFPNAGNSEEYIGTEAFVAGFEAAVAAIKDKYGSYNDGCGCCSDANLSDTVDNIGEEEV